MKMPKPCHPHCILDKRDFMQVNPPRREADYYRDYDPNVGLGTAFVLILFFLVITVKSCVRYSIRKVRMYRFDQQERRKELNNNHDISAIQTLTVPELT